MKLIIIVIFLLLINPIYTNETSIYDLESLLEYYNPETLKSKPLSKIIWTSSKGETLKRDINREIAQQILHANYKYYGFIFPGEIIIENDSLIGLTYIIMCAAGGFCEYEKLAILKKSGELIAEFDYGKCLTGHPEKLVKENVYKSDSLMIFKTSDIELNSPSASILSIEIEMQTIHISVEGEIKVVAANKIDTRRKYYWISTDIVQDSTLVIFSKQELAEMRNEIFASYGYIFKSKKWSKHFGNKDWYEARFENVNNLLSVIEKINVKKIIRHENDEIYWKKYLQDVIHYSNKQDSVRYEIQYPSNWYVKTDSFSTKYNTDILLIENIKEKVIIAGGGPFTEHGSFFKIEVLFTSRGNTIEEFILNADLPERLKKQRLEQVREMEIGGINVLVWKGSSSYEFIYEGRRFRIFFMSGSKEQFEKDLKFFEKMLESFKIIK